MTRDGHFFFGAKQAAAVELPNLIRSALRDGAERKTYLRIDGRARNADVEIILYEIRCAGISDVVILARTPTEI